MAVVLWSPSDKLHSALMCKGTGRMEGSAVARRMATARAGHHWGSLNMPQPSTTVGKQPKQKETSNAVGRRAFSVADRAGTTGRYGDEHSHFRDAIEPKVHSAARCID